jgi:hypothetical protein
MSGYLERLASSVLKPAGAIHPMVGSFFAPPQYGRPADNVLLEENVTQTTVLPAVTPPGPLASPSSGPPGFVTETASSKGPSSEDDEKPAPVDRGAARDHPRAELRARQNPAVRVESSTRLLGEASVPDDPAASRQTAATVAEPAANLVGTAKPTRPEHPREAVVIGLYEPLLAASAGGPEVASISRDASGSPPPSAATAPQSSVARRNAGPGRPEPDEIQIHIGRIEVTAVPPSVPPPPPKPAPKSVSLEEYLQRRDRRAR